MIRTWIWISLPEPHPPYPSAGTMMEGIACRLELMNWLMSPFQAGSGWSLRNKTTTSSATVLLSEAVREAWNFILDLLPAPVFLLKKDIYMYIIMYIYIICVCVIRFEKGLFHLEST